MNDSRSARQPASAPRSAATIPAVPAPSVPMSARPAADSTVRYRAVPSQRLSAENLGPLRDLPGFWQGTGFSLIARPDFSGSNPNGFFLELNLLRETIEFGTIASPVFNRGSVQGDIAVYGVTYLHRVTDGTTGEALHIEPGMWLTIPATTEPASGASIARLATIPHGTSVCTVGIAQEAVPEGSPVIPPVNTVPFPIGAQPPPPGTKNPFLEYDLSSQSPFRTAPVPAGISQASVDDPGVLLRQALLGQQITRITRLITSTDSAGGIDSIPFVVRNADTLTLDSMFAIETIRGPMGRDYLQLQYSQTALLDFRDLSYPHVTVGTLIKSF